MLKHNDFINYISKANDFLGYEVNINNIKDIIILSARAKVFSYHLNNNGFNVNSNMYINTVEYLNYYYSLEELKSTLNILEVEKENIYKELQNAILNDDLAKVKKIRKEVPYKIIKEAIYLTQSAINNYKNYMYNRIYITPIEKVTIYKGNCKTSRGNHCKKDRVLNKGQKYLLIKEFESENLFKFGDEMVKIMDENNYTYIVDKEYVKLCNNQ